VLRRYSAIDRTVDMTISPHSSPDIPPFVTVKPGEVCQKFMLCLFHIDSLNMCRCSRLNVSVCGEYQTIYEKLNLSRQDWTGAQIGNNDSQSVLTSISPEYVENLFPDSDDIKNVNLTGVHNLSGPVAVEGTEPGDCLVVDILDGASTCLKFLRMYGHSSFFQ